MWMRGTLLLLALAISSCTCAPRRPTLTRARLARLPDGVTHGSLAVNDDSTDFIYAEATPDGARVIHRGVAGPAYTSVAQTRLAPGTDGIFYWAVNGTAEAREVFLVANDTPLKIDPPIARPMQVVFTPTGKRWAVVAGTEPRDDGHSPGVVRVWVDGRSVGQFADMTQPAFSRDGKHVAALVDAGAGSAALMVDGRQVRVFDAPTRAAVPRLQPNPIGPNMPEQYAIAYLIDGRLLLLTTDRDGWAVYRGDQRLASYPGNQARAGDGPRVDFGGVLAAAPSIAAGSLSAASAAPVAAWWGRDAGAEPHWRVLRDGSPELVSCGRPTNDPPALSADGRHLAYACFDAPIDQASTVSVLHDGRRYGPYNDVWAVTISNDGRHVAFAADGGDPQRPWFYVVDGKRHRLRFDQAFPPRFSPDGAHVAWVAKRERGEPRGAKFLLFLDGNSYASSDEVVSGPHFAADGTLSWAALRGKRLSRVEVKG